MMHMRGDPSSMQQPHNLQYGDVVAEVGAELQVHAEAAMQAGVEPWSLMLDPGLSNTLHWLLLLKGIGAC